MSRRQPTFTKGDVYYRITYPDREMLFPRIESFVFVGKNLSEEDEEETCYFQLSRSFAKFGSVLENDSGDRAVTCVTEKDKGDMLDLSGLVSELEMADGRRSNTSER